MRLIDFLAASAAKHPSKPAAIHHDESITYAELWSRSQAVAAFLRKINLPPQSRAAVLFENGLDYLICYFAALAANLAVVPLDTSLSGDRIRETLNDCGAKILLAQGKYRKALAAVTGAEHPLKVIVSDKPIQAEAGTVPLMPLRKIYEDYPPAEPPAPIAHNPQKADSALAAIFYTSGSTGKSKGVQLSHKNLISNTVGTVEYLKLTDRDSVFVILPFYYIYGNSLLLTHVAAGGTLVIDNRFMYPEAILEEMEAKKASGFSGVPSNFMILLNNTTFAKRKFKDLRYFTQAGGGMAPEVTKKLMKAFPDKQIFIMYGQTEAAPRVTWLPPERLAEKVGSIGIPVPGVTIELLDESGKAVPPGETGEIVVSGDNVMLGYWNQPEETLEVLKGGKLFTNDLARRDEEGFLFIVGRRREIIKSGGNRVSAKEVEDRLLEHESVAEAAVIGVEDPLLGEAIKAVIALKPASVAEEKDLKAFCAKTLAGHKIPKSIVFVDVLPKQLSGKIDKVLLKKQHSGR